MLDRVSGHHGQAEMTCKIKHHAQLLPCKGLMLRRAGKAVSGGSQLRHRARWRAHRNVLFWTRVGWHS